MKVIEISVKFHVRERTQEDPDRYGDYGTAEWLRRALCEYLTHEEMPIRDDYGPEASGGYDGSYITGAEILSSSVRDN